jgi:hypothetical protein
VILGFRPIKDWPAGWQDPGRERSYSPFSATYSDTLQVLERELFHLGARDQYLQVDARDRDCRLDGQLRADAKVNHPGCILTIDTKAHGTLVYACDRFEGRWKQPGWQANLRAIALGLEALRRVERYGIAERGQQYAGYRELGSGIPVGPAASKAMTVEEAANVLVDLGEWGGERGDPEALIDMPDVAALYFREAAKRHHPDVGGDPALFRRIAEAKEVLDRHG